MLPIQLKKNFSQLVFTKYEIVQNIKLVGSRLKPSDSLSD